APVAPLPDIGVAAAAVAPIRPRVLEARVNQGGVPQVLDAYLGRAEIGHGVGPGEARQEARLVHEGAVGVGRAIVVGQVLRVPGHVTLLGGEEITAVEGLEGRKIVCLGRHRRTSFLRRHAAAILVPTLAPRKGQFSTKRRGQIADAPRGDAMLLNLRETSGPLYRRVYHALKGMIRAGRLGPAARVPSTRALARDLGVSRNTVMLAYEQLAAEGYLVSRHRGATSVAAVAPPRRVAVPAGPASERPAPVSAYARRLTARLDLPPARPPGPRPALRYDFRYGRPAVDEFPREIWRRLLAAHARRASVDAL